MGKIKVIKASAGSGKTYTLTQEYLKLLRNNRSSHRNILAVTFTNKATEEMKRRVIETLYQISQTDSRSKDSLIHILHDYSSFSITTIDKFFQNTMRAFAREIGRSGSYSVELDINSALSESIDNMLFNLEEGDADSQILIDWLTKLLYNQIDGGKTWNVKSALESLSKEILKESYREKRASENTLFLKNDIIQIADSLKDSIESINKEAFSIAHKAISIISSTVGEASNFKGGSRTPFNLFYKVIDKREISEPSNSFISLEDNLEGWITKKSADKDPAIASKVSEAYNSGLNDCIKDYVLLFSSRYSEYVSKKLILDNIYTLGLLSDIEKWLNVYTGGKNIVLIPQTTEILNRIIDGNDAPFIYEKIGTRIDHFMLDEFQDTSKIQWDNFKPLVNNSLSMGYDNLLVGDVKQSIYRWRGSDSDLLNSQIFNDLPLNYIEELDLDTNWRSSKNIVDFNNDFFISLSRAADNYVNRDIEDQAQDERLDSIEKIYEKSVQRLPNTKESLDGHVHLKFIPKTATIDNWREESLTYSISILERLINNGYTYNQIFFLVRTNKEAEFIVTRLLELDYPVISDEALYISSSLIIKKVISILRYIENPNSKINKEVIELLNLEIDLIKFSNTFSLYTMCEEIIDVLRDKITDSDSIFINSFLDVVLEYTQKERADLASFIKWWDLKGGKKAISSPSGQNSINVMTIHKSKGLGLPVVILPFFDMPFDHENNTPIIWAKCPSEYIDNLSIVPVPYQKKLINSWFRQDYLLEKRKAAIDNINIAYVAFTRAENELIVVSQKFDIDKIDDKTISEHLYSKYVNSIDSNNTLDFGEWSFSESVIDDKGDISIPIGNFTPIGERLKLTLKGEEYYAEKSLRSYGILMHEILSRVVIEEDLPKAIHWAFKAGLIDSEESEYIERELTHMLESVRDRGWFGGNYKVFNELEIIEIDGSISRPDRVLLSADAIVIDFKFGEKKERSHIRQIERYTRLLRETGIAYVRGYLWYLNLNEIIEC